MDKNEYLVLAYYYFTPFDQPQDEVKRHKEFFKNREASGRIYISEEGINGQMSASLEDAEAYMTWLRSDPRFAEVEFKIHRSQELVFPRMTVKLRKQLVALDEKVDLTLGGERVAPERWKEMLEARDTDTLILDVRNDYEWEIGHFEGAELPKLENFREFPAFARELKQQRDPEKTQVMMYCTGGIRCELFSAVLKKEGFENVFQLDGGVIKYGLKEGSKHWKGKLFVFDDRLAVPIDESEEGEVISSCKRCQIPSDVYYNCANMDCNTLSLFCPQCAETLQGCCCEACMEAPRRRAFDKERRPKPFRRKHISPPLQSCPRKPN